MNKWLGTGGTVITRRIHQRVIVGAAVTHRQQVLKQETCTQSWWQHHTRTLQCIRQIVYVGYNPAASAYSTQLQQMLIFKYRTYNCHKFYSINYYILYSFNISLHFYYLLVW